MEIELDTRWKIICEIMSMKKWGLPKTRKEYELRINKAIQIGRRQKEIELCERQGE